MVRTLPLALVLVAAVAQADELPEDAKAAIADRGIVLQAGKRHFFVIVPPAERRKGDPPDSTMSQSKMYFGTAKSLSDYGSSSWMQLQAYEERALHDERSLWLGQINREGANYELVCNTTWGSGKAVRKIALTAGTREAVARAAITDARRLRRGEYLARIPKTTTYLYVDSLDGGAHRLLMGKRGAMKKIAIKEMASDSSSTVFVTAKGTLTIVPGKAHTDPPTMSWGTVKKPIALDPLAVVYNKELVYLQLGVYAREPSGHPCDEL